MRSGGGVNEGIGEQAHLLSNPIEFDGIEAVWPTTETLLCVGPHSALAAVRGACSSGGGEHLAELADSGGFAQDAIDVGGNIAVIQEALSPAGQQYDLRQGRGGFDGAGDLSPVYVGHSQVGNHDVIGSTGHLGGEECVYAGLATLGRDDVVSIGLDYDTQGFKDE